LDDLEEVFPKKIICKLTADEDAAAGYDGHSAGINVRRIRKVSQRI
jgi:hypothetical protein